MIRFSKIPFHTLLIAIYPILALFAVNIHQVSISVIWRPMLISLAGAILLVVIFSLWLKVWLKASLFASFILIIFYTYGRAYDYLKSTPLASMQVVRHRYLVIIFTAILVLGIWLMLKYIRDFKPITAILNVIAIVLVILPGYQIMIYSINASSGERAVMEWTPSTSLISPSQPKNKPDVYYILLDTYARSDRIKTELGYDNTDFIKQLEGVGFYVANCSRSNYNNTHNSIVSSLNMSYLPELYAEGAERDISIPDIWMLIKPSAVRRNFETLGYKIVAFDSGFEWTRIDDADLYLQRGKEAYGVQFINPFEQMLMDSTPLKIISDYQGKASFDKYLSGTHPQANFIGQEEFILDQLPKLAAIDDPTFTFAHIDIPHPPYVFSLDGYLTDPGYWSVPVKGAVDEDHFRSGYIHAIEYIDARILEIVREILSNSEIPPIIILQGDHGYGEGNNFPILNAYYLPGVPPGKLYPTLSPINSFRLIFNELFGGQYEILPDESFLVTDVYHPVAEQFSDCLKPLP